MENYSFTPSWQLKIFLEEISIYLWYFNCVDKISYLFLICMHWNFQNFQNLHFIWFPLKYANAIEFLGTRAQGKSRWIFRIFLLLFLRYFRNLLLLLWLLLLSAVAPATPAATCPKDDDIILRMPFNVNSKKRDHSRNTNSSRRPWMRLRLLLNAACPPLVTTKAE